MIFLSHRMKEHPLYYHIYNGLFLEIDALKDYARETQGARRESNHYINRMNAEKISSSETSMIRPRDIMMSILKDMKHPRHANAIQIRNYL